MGNQANIGHGKYPRQGAWLGRRARVCFNYDMRNVLGGVIVRDDTEDPYRTIIHLDDGRFLLASECQFNLPEGAAVPAAPLATVETPATKKETCAVCLGTGCSKDMPICRTCGGAGVVVVVVPWYLERIMTAVDEAEARGERLMVVPPPSVNCGQPSIPDKGTGEAEEPKRVGNACDECDPSFGCFGDSHIPCQKKPEPIPHNFQGCVKLCGWCHHIMEDGNPCDQVVQRHQAPKPEPAPEPTLIEHQFIAGVFMSDLCSVSTLGVGMCAKPRSAHRVAQ